MTPDPSRRAAHDRAWDRVAQVALGAYVAAIVILVGLGIAELADAHPSDTWLLEAISLLGLGTVILVVTTIRRRRRASAPRRAASKPPRRASAAAPAAAAAPAVAAAPAAAAAPEPAPAPAPPQTSPPEPVAPPEPPPPLVTWQCQPDATTPGVVLFVLYPSRGTASGSVKDPPPLPSSRDLGPVACYVADPMNIGQRADDDRISRAGGVLTTRWHPAFFPGVPEPVTGMYRFRWDELREGEWHLLTEGTEWVNYRAAPPEPAVEPAAEEQASAEVP